jgi:hypothetical protein
MGNSSNGLCHCDGCGAASHECKSLLAFPNVENVFLCEACIIDALVQVRGYGQFDDMVVVRRVIVERLVRDPFVITGLSERNLNELRDALKS